MSSESGDEQTSWQIFAQSLLNIFSIFVIVFSSSNEEECEKSWLSDGRRELENICKVDARYLLNKIAKLNFLNKNKNVKRVG